MIIKRSGSSGQALVEFAYFVVFAASFVSIAGLILKEEWNRSKCVYLTFEATHRDLVSPSVKPRARGILEDLDIQHSHRQGFSIHIQKRGHQIIGTGRCGSHTETISLPFLESAKW